jgi:hypothetical protein
VQGVFGLARQQGFALPGTPEQMHVERQAFLRYGLSLSCSRISRGIIPAAGRRAQCPAVEAVALRRCAEFIRREGRLRRHKVPSRGLGLADRSLPINPGLVTNPVPAHWDFVAAAPSAEFSRRTHAYDNTTSAASPGISSNPVPLGTSWPQPFAPNSFGASPQRHRLSPSTTMPRYPLSRPLRPLTPHTAAPATAPRRPSVARRRRRGRRFRRRCPGRRGAALSARRGW